MYNNNTLCCHWCGVDLSMASQVTYLNGNLPVCQLCLIKANNCKPLTRCWCGELHDPDEHLKMGEVK